MKNSMSCNNGRKSAIETSALRCPSEPRVAVARVISQDRSIAFLTEKAILNNFLTVFGGDS